MSLSPLHTDPTVPQQFELQSPDGNLKLTFSTAEQLTWALAHKGQPVLLPSPIALELTGETLGRQSQVQSSATQTVDSQFEAINFRRKTIRDQYTQLRVDFAQDFSLEFRLYNDAAAYRFVTQKTGPITVVNEVVNFNFPGDLPAFIPYLRDYREGQIFNASFESPYTEVPLSEFQDDLLSILPMLVDLGAGKKAVVLEADLEDYPGLYLNRNAQPGGLKGVFAPYPLAAQLGGYDNMNLIPTQRADYIAQTQGARNFPWRVVVVSEKDHELLNNDIVQKLAAAPRLEDYAWVKPGLSAWEWWSDINLSHVDFKAGINTATYKYFIDFAAANHTPYIVIDAGWSPLFDLNQIVPALDLKAVVDYGKEKQVGVVLWACWFAITQQMHEIFPKYSEMGVKGFKIDFIDRDDQIAVASTYEIAQLAAQYHLMVDYHGVFKPTGLQRTYPNVIGYEGVYGLENFKWADEDQPRYDVTIPYLRNMSGPMDYTPGAMINATQADYKARNHAPMSKGTRCHQIAEYVIFEAPFQMLSDSPTAYMREQESTDFITAIPTIFDETVPLDGQIGEYVALARQKDGVWHLGAMTNWTPRDLTLDCAFLGEGQYQAVIFEDGVNADTEASDYRTFTCPLNSSQKLSLHMAPGGGWAARIEKISD